MCEEGERFIVRAVHEPHTLWVTIRFFENRYLTPLRRRAAAFKTSDEARAAITQLSGCHKQGYWTFHIDRIRR